MNKHLKISPKGVALIKEFEGLSLKSYRDAVGIWTIGYGHTRTAKPNQTITLEQANALLAQDIAMFEPMIHQHVKVPLTQGQYDALVSIVFNVGPGNSSKSGILRLNNGLPSTLLRRLNAKDYLGAALAFKDWKMAGGKVLAGLVRRREAEYNMFMG